MIPCHIYYADPNGSFSSFSRIHHPQVFKFFACDFGYCFMIFIELTSLKFWNSWKEAFPLELQGVHCC